MSLCVVCGTQLAGDTGLCSNHSTAAAEGWAVVNRLMCDFLHRGVAPSGASIIDGSREPVGFMTEAA
jgi:hypothetical protein